MVNGEKEGYGEIEGNNGETFKGNFKSGKYHGKGKHIIPNFYEFEGNFENG